MARGRVADGLLNAGLIAGAVLVGILLYGLVTRTVTPRTTPTRAAAAPVPGGARIQVELLNAAGIDGLAAAATAHLRRRGFDVLQIGNAPAQDTSAVWVRAGTPTDGRHVAAALGLPDRAVATDTVRTDYDPDVSVRLGRDYLTYAPFETEAPRVTSSE